MKLQFWVAATWILNRGFIPKFVFFFFPMIINIGHTPLSFTQEINVMVDSSALVKEWINALKKNQATAQFGQVSTDGIWRDADGNLNPNNGK